MFLIGYFFKSKWFVPFLVPFSFGLKEIFHKASSLFILVDRVFPSCHLGDFLSTLRKSVHVPSYYKVCFFCACTCLFF